MRILSPYASINGSPPIDMVTVSSPAKLNLYLEILGKRGDGFHELETLMTTVSLADQIRFIKRNDQTIQLKIIGDSSCDQIPTDQRNLIVRALQLVRARNPQIELFGCDVLLYKSIPSAAGLGGASSNAAAALLAAGALWNLNFGLKDRQSLAEELGSDVPFFLYGGTAICRGRGEKIEPIRPLIGIPVVIAKPREGLSTASVFANVKFTEPRHSMEAIHESVKRGSCFQTAKNLFNRLQDFSIPLNGEISKILRLFEKTNSLGYQMSGSGSSCFGLYRSGKEARRAAKLLSIQMPDARIFCCQTFSQPILSFN